MDSIKNTGKYLQVLRWTVLLGGVTATTAGWILAGQMTPMILLPTTLGVLGFVILYVLWSVGFLMERSQQRVQKLKKEMISHKLQSRKVVWNEEVTGMRN